MVRDRGAVVAIVVGTALAGCVALTPAQVTIANRSNAILTLGPGLVIPPCASRSMLLTDYQATQKQAVEMARNEETWDAPDGAVVWWSPPIAVAQSTVASGTITFVVSSASEPDVRAGTLTEAELPACGGAPRGIEPDAPQAEQ